MQKLFFAGTLTLVIGAVALACTEPDGTIVAGSPGQAGDETTVTLFGSAGIDPVSRNATEENHRAALTRYGEVRAAVIDAISAGGTAHEVEARVSNVVASSGVFVYRPYVEQYAACRLLEMWLSEDAPAYAHIERHTSTLLRHSNPDASLLLPALTKLRDVWTEARIRAAARETIQRATRWSQKVCPDCHAKEVVGAAGSSPAVSQKRTDVVSAIAALESLAGP